jgi:hypothetical protein
MYLCLFHIPNQLYTGSIPAGICNLTLLSKLYIGTAFIPRFNELTAENFFKDEGMVDKIISKISTYYLITILYPISSMPKCPSKLIPLDIIVIYVMYVLYTILY